MKVDGGRGTMADADMTSNGVPLVSIQEGSGPSQACHGLLAKGK